VLIFEITAKRYNIHLTFVMVLVFLCSLTCGALVGWLVMNWWKMQLMLTAPVALSVIAAYL